MTGRRLPTCEWIEGEPGSQSCGAPSCSKSRSWCQKHYDRVFQQDLAALLPCACWVPGSQRLHNEDTDDIKTLIQENTELTSQVKKNTDLLEEIHLHVSNIGKKVGADMGHFPPVTPPPTSN